MFTKRKVSRQEVQRLLYFSYNYKFYIRGLSLLKMQDYIAEGKMFSKYSGYLPWEGGIPVKPPLKDFTLHLERLYPPLKFWPRTIEN